MCGGRNVRPLRFRVLGATLPLRTQDPSTRFHHICPYALSDYGYGARARFVPHNGSGGKDGIRSGSLCTKLAVLLSYTETPYARFWRETPYAVTSGDSLQKLAYLCRLCPLMPFISSLSANCAPTHSGARYARESSSLATLANVRWVLVARYARECSLGARWLRGLRGARMRPFISCTAPLRDDLRGPIVYKGCDYGLAIIPLIVGRECSLAGFVARSPRSAARMFSGGAPLCAPSPPLLDRSRRLVAPPPVPPSVYMFSLLCCVVSVVCVVSGVSIL